MKLNPLISTVFATALVATSTASPTDNASTINHICNSAAPLLVIDNFKTRAAGFGINIPAAAAIDLDGDGIKDIAHGDMVAKVAELSGKQVITYGIVDHFRQEDIIAAYKDIITRIKQNEIPAPSAIVMSLSFTINTRGITDYAKGVTDLSASNLQGKQSEVVSSLASGSIPEKLFQEFHALKVMGIPVITAAGNGFSNDSYNFYGMLGAITIGASTTDGQIAPYSNQSSLTSIYRTGDYIARKTADGIDINNDGIAEFSADILSGQQELATRFNGTTVRLNRITKNDWFKDGFYRLEDFLNATGMNSLPGNFKTYGQYIHYPSLAIFRTDQNGKLLFDPTNDRSTNQVSLVMGTSFAAPAICSQPPALYGA